MVKKRLYTFIVSTHSAGKVWRISLPYSILVSMGIVAILGAMSLGAGAFQYRKMLFMLVDYERRVSENDSLRSENDQFKVQAAQLGEKIDFLDGLSHKLMVFSGMSSEQSVGGVGGNLNQPRPASDNLANSLTTYTKKISSLEQDYRDLDNRITEEVLYEAAQPNILPVQGYVTEGYGRRTDPFDPTLTEYHPGVDISAPAGIRVVAPADGTVIFAGQRAGYGRMIVIDHKFGLTTRYGHLLRMDVQVGQHVTRHEIIGYVGSSGRSTGPHLHFELWRNDRTINPLKFIQAFANPRSIKP